MVLKNEKAAKNNVREYIKNTVHELYYKYDINCARTMLICLSVLLDIKIETQTMDAALGMHGAGGFRAQCGLVEGGLMFIGLYYKRIGKSDDEVIRSCYQYGEAFTKRFGSLRCLKLRPGGFSENDPPHLCEQLTCEAILFTYGFIEKITPLFVGVDRMHSCWIAVEIQNNSVKAIKYKSILEICEVYNKVSNILIDMPIGLPESLEEDEMRPDKMARKMLFGERKSSIFPVPCRQAVWEECEEKAKEINKKVLGKSLSKQSFAICKTIKQIDEYLEKNPQWKNRLCESHPEVAFQMLNHGERLRFSKHKEDGITERIEILKCHGINIQQVLKEFKREEYNDVLDATCLALMAKLGRKNGFITIPQIPVCDQKGLKMQMLFGKCNPS